MIGTVLVAAQPLADLEPVEPRQHDVEHHEVDRRVREAAQRLLAVGGLDDRVPVLLEREREHLADGVLVVDEQDRGSRFGHGGRPAARIALAMAMARTPARRRRARRGSLERPINARLYRGSLLVLSLPLLILAFSITRPGALPAPLLPPNFDGEATRQLATDFSTHFPDRVPGGPGSLQRRPVVPRPARAVRPAGHRPTPGSEHVPGPRARAPPQPLGGRRRAVVGRDRRDGAPRRHGHRPGRERRRERHRRAGRARTRVRTGRHTGRPARALRAHDRLSLHRRRLLRRARRAAVRRALAVPRRRDDQPRRDRRPRAAAHRDRRRQPALTGGLARRDRREARARADRDRARGAPGSCSS